MLFGKHIDDLLAYETQKIVRIRDRRLGLTYIGFVILIASYVVGYPSPLRLAISWNQKLAIAIAKAICDSNGKHIDRSAQALDQYLDAPGPFWNVRFGNFTWHFQE